MLGYSGLAIIGGLGLDGAMLPWFLLIMFLYLAFAIWLSLVLAGVAVSDSDLSVRQTFVFVLLVDQFSLCTQECRYSCKTCSLVVVFGYVALWPQSTLGVGQNWKTPFPGRS